jgi:hypothetical protein
MARELVTAICETGFDDWWKTILHSCHGRERTVINSQGTGSKAQTGWQLPGIADASMTACSSLTSHVRLLRACSLAPQTQHSRDLLPGVLPPARQACR